MKMATAFEQGRASMAIALPRRNTEQLCFIFFAYNFGILPSASVSWLQKAVTEL